MFKVVDLGTKNGNAITEFLRNRQLYFASDNAGIRPADCLGIDLQSKYQKSVESKGYQFAAMDVLQELTQLPEADYYLAWDFLEHLPTVTDSNIVVSAMLQKAAKGVWLRLPSFESDMTTGEGRLREHGLRFAWTHWSGHTSHYLLRDALDTINAHAERQQMLKVRAGRKIGSTADKSIVPVEAPIDTIVYSADVGPKPVFQLNPPVVGQWEVVVGLE